MIGKKKLLRWKEGVRGLTQMELDDFVESPKHKPKPKAILWHEYNLAKTSEKICFMNLLSELVLYVEEKKQTGRGRPRLDLREMIYCMVLAAYHGKSSRRTISELQISKDRGLISHVPSFNSILGYFNNRSLIPILQHLIQLSSMPLRFVEDNIGVDSTSFSTSMFARWFEHKWGKDGKHRVWRKAHVSSGSKTRIITWTEITKGVYADTLMFPILIERTAQNL